MGRDPDVDVTLDDDSVSRRHAAIIKSGEHYYLRDLQSKNGTYFHGILQGAEQVLTDGDCFRIGNSDFVFRLREDSSVATGRAPAGGTEPKSTRGEEASVPAQFSRQLPDHSPQERPRREARPAMADADEVQDPRSSSRASRRRHSSFDT